MSRKHAGCRSPGTDEASADFVTVRDCLCDGDPHTWGYQGYDGPWPDFEECVV